MKELYISPELEILSFAPMQKLAGTWGNSFNTYGNAGTNHGNGMDSNPEATGDYTEPVDPGEDLL